LTTFPLVANPETRGADPKPPADRPDLAIRSSPKHSRLDCRRGRAKAIVGENARFPR
jgi:hypothetical protein